MLREHNHIDQKDSDPGFRRWFSGQGVDLVIWTNQQDQIIAFQFCCDLDSSEKAVSWKSGGVCSYSRVDSGDDFGPLKNPSSLLVKDQGTYKDLLLENFRINCQNLEKSISKFIIEKLTS